eukprot:CAMPEP_0204619636 /NCGR_PEP_ID=MMETSP0717-20131115/5934_1 /ASSEMBLY_ACC=CAM_ASM_000666 /TAXON_ID=230516 /ORGANISM="Chaetoceros curvisetus" /LENGTH=448 /DNA_ID=CAMNT_0051633667 /DNA_START=82 /DNA_END=1428 /DNA_ORIENTATION=-
MTIRSLNSTVLAFLLPAAFAFHSQTHRISASQHTHTATHTGTSASFSTALYGAKDNHRARLEKNLEDMMDRDWRVFRAGLVAKEVEEQNETKNPKSTNYNHLTSSSSNHHHGHSHHNHHVHHRHSSSSSSSHAFDEKQAKQEKFGNIFAAIFKSAQDNTDTYNNIFDGSNVGNAGANTNTSHGKGNGHGHHPPYPSALSSLHSMIPLIPESCKDPFVTRAEIPVLMQPSPSTKINKHRWAHPLTHIEAGCVLIANEKLGGVFHQTVVLVIEHNDVIGSTGIVINRPLEGTLNKVATETESNLDLSLKLAFNASPVTYGGPVAQEEYSILHGYGEVSGSKKIAPGIFVGGSEELMSEVRKKNMEMDQALFVKGHAAWVPNQLAREVSKGVWYPASVSTDFILRYAGALIDEDQGDNVHDLWADILSCLGGKYEVIANTHSSKGDRRMKP